MHKLVSLVEYHQFHLKFEQPIKWIKEGNELLLIVDNNGELYVNGRGEICNEKLEYFAIPGMNSKFIKINEINNVKLIGCGHAHAVIINELNEIFIFGNINFKDKYLQLVNKYYIYQVSIKNLTKNPEFKQVTCGFDNIILVTKENILYVAGVNTYSQLGCESKGELKSFRKVDTLRRVNIIDVQCGDNHTLILDNLGNIYCSGSSKEAKFSQFTKLDILFKVKRISCLPNTSVLLSTTNDLYTFNDGTLERVKTIPNIKINNIYSSYFDIPIYLVSEDGNCYKSEYHTLDFSIAMDRKDSCKDLRYLTVLPGNSIVVYSDYLINNEKDINDCKGIKLFKRVLMDSSLQNRVTDISFN